MTFYVAVLKYKSVVYGNEIKILSDIPLLLNLKANLFEKKEDAEIYLERQKKLLEKHVTDYLNQHPDEEIEYSIMEMKLVELNETVSVTDRRIMTI